MSDPSPQSLALEAILQTILSAVQELRGQVLDSRKGVSELKTSFQEYIDQMQGLVSAVHSSIDAARLIATEFRPWLEKLEAQLSELRSVSLCRIDDVKGTLDLLREDVRTNWMTADFAISNSRNGREDVDKLIQLVTGLQRSQQMLTSQVDELRKAAQERDAGLSKGL